MSMLPNDWQDQVQKAIKKMQADDPAKAIFGLILPKAWKIELWPFVHNGELRRLCGVQAITFDGKTIGRIDGPPRKETTVRKGA